MQSLHKLPSKGTRYAALSHDLIIFPARDRENCTVFVSDLPQGATEHELAELFRDVGPIFASLIRGANSGAYSAALYEKLKSHNYPGFQLQPWNSMRG